MTLVGVGEICILESVDVVTQTLNTMATLNSINFYLHRCPVTQAFTLNLCLRILNYNRSVEDK